MIDKLKWITQTTILGMYSFFYGLIYVQSLMKNFTPITIEINHFGEGIFEIVAFGILLIFGTYFVLKDYMELHSPKTIVNKERV